VVAYADHGTIRLGERSDEVPQVSPRSDSTLVGPQQMIVDLRLRSMIGQKSGSDDRRSVFRSKDSSLQLNDLVKIAPVRKHSAYIY